MGRSYDNWEHAVFFAPRAGFYGFSERFVYSEGNIRQLNKMYCLGKEGV